METAATTQNQSTHQTPPIAAVAAASAAATAAAASVSVASIDRTASSTFVSSIIGSTAGTSQQTRNKRKNFNPRCSVNDDDEFDNGQSNSGDNSGCINISSNQQHHHLNNVQSTPSVAHNNKLSRIIIDPSAANNSTEITLDTMSINWRKSLDNQSTATTTVPTTGSATINSTNNSNKNDESQYYSIPNTNFSISKSALGLAAVAVASQQSSGNLHTDGGPADPQARLELACNVFHVVQELQNVYGFSISPNDIVDALKRQAFVGEYFAILFYFFFLFKTN